MKSTFCILSLIFSTFCFAQKEFQPKGSTLIETIDGDLDGDKIPEKVIIYNTKDEGELGKIREIQILKKVNGKWTILEKSRKAVLESDAGGMMGDPYQNTTIKNGILIITHYGGSSWKWGVTDKYRFQNGHFELIGYFSEGGRPGDYWATTDFNLSTGKVIYKKDVENSSIPENGKSESETYIKKGVKINLQNRNQDQERKFVLPKTRKTVYL
jgi:hypothetical protein